MAISKKDKLYALIKQVLLDRGWEIALHDGSGAFTKKNFIFVLHGYDFDNRLVVEGIHNVRPFAKPLLTYKGASWHIEQYGFLVDKGAISGTLTNAAANYTDVIPEEAKAFAASIDAYTAISESDLMSMKMQEKSFVMKEKCLVPVIIQGSVMDVKKFMLNPNADDDFAQVFNRDTIYEIGAVTAGPNPTNKVQGAKVTFTAYNADCSALTKKSDALDLDLFTQLCEAEVLVAVQLQMGVKDSPNTQWVKVTTDSYLQIPTEFDVFNLNTVQRVILSKALGAGVNFTPLLNSELSKEELEAMLELLKDGGEAEYLIGKHFNVDQLNALDNIAKAGFSIKTLANEKYNAEYITIQFNNTLVGLERLRRELSSQDFDPANIQGIIQLAYNSEMQIIQRENEPIGVLDLHYKSEHETGNYAELVNSILAGRIVDYMGNVFASLVSIPAKLRAELYSYFALDEKAILANDMFNWHATFNDILGKADYLAYSSKLGFFLRCGNSFVCRDSNSVFVCDSTYKPIWRGVYINGKIYCNREFKI